MKYTKNSNKQIILQIFVIHMLNTWDKHNYSVEFEVGNIQTSMANAIRRLMISEVKSVGFRTEPYEACQIKIIENDTPLHNQFVLHRLSMIPIHVANPDKFDVDDYVFIIDIVNNTNSIITYYYRTF